MEITKDGIDLNEHVYSDRCEVCHTNVAMNFEDLMDNDPISSYYKWTCPSCDHRNMIRKNELKHYIVKNRVEEDGEDSIRSKGFLVKLYDLLIGPFVPLSGD